MPKPFKLSYKSKNPKTGKIIRKKSRKYYANIKNADGVRKRVPLATDRVASEQMLNEFVRQAEREKVGLIDPFAQNRLIPICEHINAYQSHLKSKANADSYIKPTIARIDAICNECKFKRITDISASQVADFLKNKRENGMSITTSNHYLTAIKGFIGWMVKDRRTGDNPLAHLTRLNAQTDLRRERRSLPETEFQLLLNAAVVGKTICGLTGSDRKMLYLTAAYTGLRASELASLSISSFNFNINPATVTLEAAYSKHRRKDVLPLHPDFALRLQGWLSEQMVEGRTILSINKKVQPRTVPLWAGNWAKNRHGAKMVKADLEVAGLPYKNESGLVFDFHALRGQFITQLGRSGVNLQDAQKLARHSDPRLTSNHYNHLSVLDLGNAVSKLPSIPASKESDRATGSG